VIISKPSETSKSCHRVKQYLDPSQLTTDRPHHPSGIPRSSRCNIRVSKSQLVVLVITPSPLDSRNFFCARVQGSLVITIVRFPCIVFSGTHSPSQMPPAFSTMYRSSHNDGAFSPATRLHTDTTQSERMDLPALRNSQARSRLSFVILLLGSGFLRTLGSTREAKG